MIDAHVTNRPLELGDTVYVYRNLTRGCWSIRCTGPRPRVMAHAFSVLLNNPVLRVSEAGRQRVIREKRKNVHAGVIGELLALDPDMAAVTALALGDPRWVIATYDPYKWNSFVASTPALAAGGPAQPITSARRVYLDPNMKLWCDSGGQGYYRWQIPTPKPGES